jgi:(R,R)-butanediol dehydrogenase/meso-butanediol dehydrogenase/diacetyl reductase
MRAVRYYGKEDVRLEDIEPQELKPGTVRINPAYVGVCGSDLHLYFDGPVPPAPADAPHPLSGEQLPVTFGHEFSGVVTELGEGVTDLKVGERVVVEPLMVCGECDQCKSGHYNRCAKMGFIGISGKGGGMSDSIVVERQWVHPVGDLPLDQAALIEPLSVAVHAVRSTPAKAGDTAIVGGAGPIGLLVAASLKAIGVNVIMTELSAARKQRAVELGLTEHMLDPRGVDVVAEVKKLTGGAGADLAFEATGAAPVLYSLTESLRAGGWLEVVAIHVRTPELRLNDIQYSEKIVSAAMGYANNHAEAIELARSGNLPLDGFITGVIAPEDLVEKGFNELKNNGEAHVKILVKVHGDEA